MVSIDLRDLGAFTGEVIRLCVCSARTGLLIGLIPAEASDEQDEIFGLSGRGGAFDFRGELRVEEIDET